MSDRNTGETDHLSVFKESSTFQVIQPALARRPPWPAPADLKFDRWLCMPAACKVSRCSCGCVNHPSEGRAWFGFATFRLLLSASPVAAEAWNGRQRLLYCNCLLKNGLVECDSSTPIASEEACRQKGTKKLKRHGFVACTKER